MSRLYVITLLLVLFVTACTTVKNPGTIQNGSLPSPDSFRTADLFFLPSEKQLLYFQSIDRILPVNRIEAGKKKHRLVEAFRNLSNFSFSYKDTLRTLEEFMQQTSVVGLIVIKNDSILLEQYREGIGPSTKWVNFSVAKSVTSLLYGAALEDGLIQNLGQKVPQYMPELVGSVYDSVSLRDLLQMSSGVAWNDDPRNPESDLMKVGRLEGQQGWSSVVTYLASLKRAAPPGQKFNYNTIETALAGVILKKIVGKPLAAYLSEKIWKPFGMYEDANWVKSRTIDVENGGCCISATLRDYALLGLFALNNGIALNGKQALPSTWMQESTTPAKSYKGYGYYWWLGTNGRYFASGSFGQQIEVDPKNKIVVAVQSHWPVAFNNYYLGYMDTMFEKLITALK